MPELRAQVGAGHGIRLTPLSAPDHVVGITDMVGQGWEARRIPLGENESKEMRT